MEQEITKLLEEARSKIGEASNLIAHLKVYDKVGEEYYLTPEFEASLKGIYEIEEAVSHITTERKEKGSLDHLRDYVKGKLIEFFQENHKQKKYEGDLVEVGYRVTRRKAVTDDADTQFIKIEKKPNTEAIDAYKKATKSDKNPDGLLPKGVIETSYEYISFKGI